MKHSLPIISISISFILLTASMTRAESTTPDRSKENTSPETVTAKPVAYSLNPDAMSLMEQQLKLMLKQKMVNTPRIDPDKALPPIVLKADVETELKAGSTSTDFFIQLISAAKDRTHSTVKYDGSYRYISYPMGDVAPNRGVCTDVVIRSYRKLGVDLQQLVHEDIKDNFRLYPSRSRWGNIQPDPNIDHRRVYNLQVFFQRFATSLPITSNPEDYQPGDLVTWRLAPKMPHIGVVVDEYSEDYPDQPLIVHNIGAGPKQEDILFSFPITGHYRYKPGKIKPSASFLVKKSRRAPSPITNSLVEAAYFLLP